MKKLVLVLMMVLMATMVFANSNKEKGDDMIHIGLSMDSLESAFWVANYQGIVDAAEEAGVKLTSLMAEGDAVKQNQQIENLIASGIDALIIAPKDGAAIASAVKKAQAAGIPVIMNNRPVQGSVVAELTVLSNSTKMAADATEFLAMKAKKDGTVYKTILLIGNLTDQNAVERVAGHKAIIAKYPGVFDVVSEIPTEWSHEIALKGLQNALQANPDANLIITPSDYLFPPIKSALEQAGKWAVRGEDNHVALITFDGDAGGMQYLKDGYSEVDAAQDATGTGAICVEWAIKLINGETPADPVTRDPGLIVTMDNFADVAPGVWSYSQLK